MYTVKKLINGGYVITKEDDIKISKFIPCGLFDIIKDEVPNNYYILGVCYDNDNQICMSGKMKENEIPLISMKRELKEELNISTNKLIYCNSKYNNIFYKLNISNTKLINYTETDPNIDIHKRVVCCVYGTYKNMIKYINTINLNTSNEDNIIGVWTASKKDILNIITTIKGNY